MAVEAANEKYSIKNLLFYRAIPNYEPENTEGHTVYACKDCGDRFLLESSYQYHIQRKSVQITYRCRHCAPRMIFHNRCNLLSHIRSHTFKTATINVSDLKIDPLPLSFYKYIKSDEITNTKITSIEKAKPKPPSYCFDCKKDIRGTGPIYKDRANHYMEYTNKVFSCPVCLFTLPTSCALKAHLRIHLKIPPFYCPECGINMSTKSIIYPFNHSCEGFNMMRATTRQPCPVSNCNFFHPSDYKTHMKIKHLKKIFSCPSCVVACFNEATLKKHISTAHNQNRDALISYQQCEMCPGRLVMQSHVERHLNNHKLTFYVYPCWVCNTTFKEIPDLVNHHLQNHDQNDELKNSLLSIETMKKSYRVVKRCDQCSRSFTYKCHFEDIQILPNACPFKCTPVSTSIARKDNSKESAEMKIKCPLCKETIDEKWANIKKHFSLYHKDHVCKDAVIPLTRICINKYLKEAKKRKGRFGKINIKKRPFKHTKKIIRQNEDKTENICPSLTNNNEKNVHVCNKCQDVYDTKEALESHIVTNHRDPCMAYQCMECGDCFVVKPSFSIHLSFHGISDVDEYIKRKNCFNVIALSKCVDNVIEEPVDENQCNICRERFEDIDDLQKHFRVHGMAFLMKNSMNKSALP